MVYKIASSLYYRKRSRSERMFKRFGAGTRGKRGHFGTVRKRIALKGI